MLSIKIENEPAEGAEYVSTRTALSGIRIELKPAVNSLPGVAAPPE